MNIQTYFDRAADVLGRAVVEVHRQRLETAATELSLAGDAQAHLDVAISSMMGLIGTLYQPDTDGRPANYDMRTGRILIPVPWGESGWRNWGLRRWEGACLRRLLIDRVGQRRRLPALFDYNKEARQWHVAAHLYPDANAALAWLRKDGPSLAEWRTIVDAHRTQNRERMQRRRSGSV